MHKNRKRLNKYFLLILLLGVTVGFALLSTTLKINGTAGIKSNTWNIHWDDTSINVTEGSITAEIPEVSTDESTKDTVSFDVELELPGDFYEFTVDAINEGTIDGELQLAQNWITYKSNDTATTLPEYMDFDVTYDDDTTPTTGNILKATESKTYKIRVEYKSNVEELPENPQPITIEVNLPYVQHKSAPAVPLDFETSPWEDIIDAYEDDPTQFQQDMEDGTTREVQLDLDNDGTAETTAHVRIANLSKCSNGESASACGFVLEFVEVIDEHRMNPWDNNYYPSTNGNASYGGWKYCEMKQYLNTTILNALPSDLQSAIITTPMISGHSNRESNNFTTNDDKLYLFGTREIWEEGSGFAQYFGIKVKDSAYDNERQLDYYRIKGVLAVPGTTVYPEAVKKNLNGDAVQWALRTAEYDSNYGFQIVATDGYYNTSINPNIAVGVSPAFRIAE